MGSAHCSFSLSSFSLSRQSTPNATWLTGCLLVTHQCDFSDILVIPRGTNYFWKAEMSFPLFPSQLLWVLSWTSWGSIWCPSLQPVLSTAWRKANWRQEWAFAEEHRQQNPLYPHPLLHSHHQCWCFSADKFWVLAWGKMWDLINSEQKLLF